MYLATAEATPTAGGAAFDEILIAAAMAAAFFAVSGWTLLRERGGHRTLVGRGADLLGGLLGLPGWAALPVVFLPVFWLVAGFGVYWDVPLHLQRGRDEGPLANPSHYPIFLVLLALANIGVLMMAVARDPLPSRTLRLSRTWRVPWSSAILTLAGFIGVLGFPLDDLWHRLFGQDVTEWGPTHVLMIGAAITSPLCLPLALAEARRAGARLLAGRAGRWLMALALSFQMLPFAFLMEFDLGIPQFPASTQFLILAFVLTWVCVTARLWFGPGGALIALVLWWFAHLFLVAVIAVLPGVLTIEFLMAAPAAVLVELLTLALAPQRHPRRLVGYAVATGALVGSLGMYAEWLWSRSFMPLPQPFDAEVLPFLLAVSTVAGIGGGLLALWQVRRLQDISGVAVPDSALPRAPQAFRHLGLAGLGTFVVLMGVFAPPGHGEPYAAEVTYGDVTGGATECTTEARCEARVTLRLRDGDLGDDMVWFYALAWQGAPNGAPEGPVDPEAGIPGVVRTAMLPTSTPGEYRSEHRLPLYGSWKTVVRLHEAPRSMTAFPLYMPDDPAIESARGREVRVAHGEVVSASYEPHLLQRERRDDIPAGLYTAANVIVFSLWVLVLLGFGHFYNRAARVPDHAVSREEVTA